MTLCGLSVEEGIVNVFGALDDAAQPLAWLASLSACGLRVDIACQDETCSRALTPGSVHVDDVGLVVDMGRQGRRQQL